MIELISVLETDLARPINGLDVRLRKEKFMTSQIFFFFNPRSFTITEKAWVSVLDAFIFEC